MAEICQKCKRKLEKYDNFCPWCGYERTEELDTDYQLRGNRDTKTTAKKAISVKLLSFKISRWRDAIIGLVAVMIMAIFIVFVAAEYISNNTYQASVTSYLKVQDGTGGYKQLIDAVGEDLFKDVVSDYYKLELSDIKEGIEKLQEGKETESFTVEVNLKRELDEIDLLAYKHSKTDDFGSGFDIPISGGYEVEAVKSSKGKEDEKQTVVVLRVENEWCTYDALELLSEAAAESRR